MHNPWKVRGLILLGMAVLACVLFASEIWQVVLIVLAAIAVFVYALKTATADPYDLRELDLLEHKFTNLSVESKTAICPHCGEEYPAKRSLCPHCFRAP
ncbi:MAG: hypothetical protein ABIV13_03015 [Fimbriimonadales bacterium]